MRRAHTQEGFSTVELLIALFIAAAFIATGFQLFSVVTEDSTETRLRAKAGSIVNQTIQKHINSVNSVCGPVPPSVITTSLPASDLPQATSTVTFSCPYGDASRTTRINVAVTYGTPQEMVEGSLDVSH